MTSKLGVLSQSSQKIRAELEAALADAPPPSAWVICSCGMWHPAGLECPDGEAVSVDG